MGKITLLVFLLTMTLISCNRSGVKFKPQERHGTLSIADRDSAIAKKKRETNLDPDVMLFQHNRASDNKSDVSFNANSL